MVGLCPYGFATVNSCRMTITKNDIIGNSDIFSKRTDILDPITHCLGYIATNQELPLERVEVIVTSYWFSIVFWNDKPKIYDFVTLAIKTFIHHYIRL